MQKKRKKFWLGFGIACAVIVSLCTIFALVTGVKTVTVEFTSRLKANSQLEKGTLDKVKDSGEFDFGKSLLFLNLDKNIEKIEKSNPYVKVEKVVRHFPNVVRVYISERTPRYRIKDFEDETKWYILDKDFKVVDVVTGDIKANNYGTASYYDKTVEIQSEDLKKSFYVGNFVDEEFNESCFNSIVKGVQRRTNGEFSMIKTISISSTNNEFTFTLTMKNGGINNDEGCKIVATGVYDLEDKIFSGINYFYTSGGTDVDLSNNTITIVERNGEYVGIGTEN